jgi:hypothetical protein
MLRICLALFGDFRDRLVRRQHQMAYTQAQLDEIQQVQEQRSLTRKSAIQFCTRKWKAAAQAAAATATKPAKKVKGDKPAKAHKSAAYPDVHFNVERICKLFKDGKNVSEIAQAVGYPKGHGNNRTRAALVKAGLIK